MKISKSKLTISKTRRAKYSKAIVTELFPYLLENTNLGGSGFHGNRIKNILRDYYMNDIHEVDLSEKHSLTEARIRTILRVFTERLSRKIPGMLNELSNLRNQVIDQTEQIEYAIKVLGNTGTSYRIIKVGACGFSPRLFNALFNSELYTLGDVEDFGIDRLFNLRNMGRRSKEEFISFMKFKKRQYKEK